MTERHKDQLILVLAVLCIVLAVALGKREVGGYSLQRNAMPSEKYWATDCRMSLHITPYAKQLCELVGAGSGKLGCAGISNGNSWMIVSNFASIRDVSAYGMIFVHEPAHGCKRWGAEHPR